LNHGGQREASLKRGSEKQGLQAFALRNPEVTKAAWLQAAWIGVLHQKNIEECRIYWPAGQQLF
jgi:hypothetical protein